MPPDSPQRAVASGFNHILAASSNANLSEGNEYPQPYQSYNKYRLDTKNYALQAAASKGHCSVLRLMLDHWDSLHISSVEVRNALHEGSMNGHENVVRLLINSKLDMLPYLEGALKEAASHGHLEIVNIFLAYEEAFKPNDDRKAQNNTPTEKARRLFVSPSKQVHRLFLL